MKRTARRPSRPARPDASSDAPQGPQNPVTLSDDAAPPDVPAHVWRTLQAAGEEAAQRLLSILRSPQFASYAPTAQKALIELALTRAYGLPVRRSIEVNLSTDDADAVAASLASLRDALPERQSGRTRPLKVVSGHDDAEDA